MSQPRQSFFSRWTPAEIMLAVLFLLAPLYYHPNLGGEGLRIPNNSTTWLVALIFIAYSLNKVIKSETYQLPRYFIFIAAFPILVIISGFLAGVEQPLKWLFRVLFILGGLAFFFSLFQHKFRQGRWDRLLLIIALSGLIHAGIGLLQIWLKADMPYLLPKSPEGIPSGLFQQINNQATFLVTSIVLAFYLASRPILFKRQPLFQLFTVLMVLAAAFIIGFSGSRIGFLTLAVAMPILLVARKKTLIRNKVFTVVLLLALVAGFVSGLIPSGGKAMDKTVAMQSGYSGSARLGIYNISFDLLKQEPLFGHGIGSFAREFQHAKPGFYAEHQDAKLPKEMVGHPHNEMFQWMVEGGLTAILGIIFVVTGVIVALRKSGASRGWSYLALLIPISLHTQVELPLYMSAVHWFALLLLMALPFVHLSRQRNNGMTMYAQKLSAITVLTLTLIFVLFLTHTIRANWDFVAFYKGKQSENPLPIAKQNPYLSEQAQWIDMSAMMYSSIQYGLRENVVYFTKWGEQLLQQRPDVDLYIKLTDAYEFLGDKEHYCETAKQGLAIYPQSERLKSAVNFCQY
ncbi:MAG: O-antigen ligase C-terminal domain-containing protein [Methylophaga sp.]|nr:O-antigen ligase C-terminal domain-containing protein [Methylophaga sp.]